MAMNTQELQGQWNELRGKIKEKWGQLADDDLAVVGGNVDQLIGLIQKKTGEGREAIEGFLGGLTSGGSAAVARVAETVRDYSEYAGERLEEGYQRAEGMVRRRPAPAVATAVGLGFVVGVLLVLAVRRN